MGSPPENHNLGDDSSLHPGIQTGLVAASGVFMDDALLNTFIKDGDGRAVNGAKAALIALCDRFTHAAERAPKLAFVGSVHCGFGFRLAGALQRGDMICHGSKLFLDFDRS